MQRDLEKRAYDGSRSWKQCCIKPEGKHMQSDYHGLTNYCLSSLVTKGRWQRKSHHSVNTGTEYTPCAVAVNSKHAAFQSLSLLRGSTLVSAEGQLKYKAQNQQHCKSEHLKYSRRQLRSVFQGSKIVLTTYLSFKYID